MIGAGAVQLFPVSRFSNADALLSLLATGGPVVGRIVPEVSGVALSLHQHRLPLPPGTQIPPGTVVEVRITDQDGIKQLQLRPQAPSAESTPPAPLQNAPALAVLREVLAALPRSIGREQAAAILPRAEGLPRDTMRSLLQLLVGRERLGAMVAQLADAIIAAVSAGRLPVSFREKFSAIAGRMLAETAAEFERAIRAAREILAGRPSTAQTARVVQGGSLLDELTGLRDQVLTQSGTGSPQTDTVLKALDTLIERLDTARMQNVRGFEAPYQFVEIPLSGGTGFDRAQVHFFGDEPAGTGAEAKSHSVVLDLELSELGPIWIALHSSGRSCACIMRVASELARSVLADGSPALENALRAAGYDGVSVQTEPWDGERVSALAAMSTRFGGFEATA